MLHIEWTPRLSRCDERSPEAAAAAGDRSSVVDDVSRYIDLASPSSSFAVGSSMLGDGKAVPGGSSYAANAASRVHAGAAADDGATWDCTENHPLLSSDTASSRSSPSTTPVTHSAPASAAASPERSNTKKGVETWVNTELHDRLSLRSKQGLNRKAQQDWILRTYTSNAGFPVPSLGDNDQQDEADRTRMRAQQLSAPAAPLKPTVMSQNELVAHVEGINNDLNVAWTKGERVKSLRLTIQACKLLGNTKVLECYPSVFILVAQVLDNFGDLVYHRIEQQAIETSPISTYLKHRGTELLPHEATDEAIETCKNWFFKIASIRELLPRIYVELALLRCMRFMPTPHPLPDDYFPAIVRRLGSQIRGVGDPLVANHARMYLCMRAEPFLRSIPNWGCHLHGVFFDFFATRSQLIGPYFTSFLEERGLNFAAYYELFRPSVQWMLDTVIQASRMTEAIPFVEKVLQEYRRFSNQALMLKIIVESIPAECVWANFDEFLKLMQCAEEPECGRRTTRVDVAEAIGRSLALVPAEIPVAIPRKQLHAIGTMCLASRECAKAWLLFFCSRFRQFRREVSTALGQLCVGQDPDQQEQHDSTGGRTTSPIPAAEGDAHAEMFSMLLALVENTPGVYIPILIRNEKFLAMHGRHIARSSVSQKKTLARALLAKAVLKDQTSDDVVTVQVIKESLQAVGEDTESDRLFVERTLLKIFSDAHDLDFLLRVLCDIRSAFSSDSVLVAVLSVAHKALLKSRGQNLKKSLRKALLAFCHVTIPSLDDPRQAASLLSTTVLLTYSFGFVAQGCDMLLSIVALPDPNAEAHDFVNHRIALGTLLASGEQTNLPMVLLTIVQSALSFELAAADDSGTSTALSHLGFERGSTGNGEISDSVVEQLSGVSQAEFTFLLDVIMASSVKLAELERSHAPGDVLDPYSAAVSQLFTLVYRLAMEAEGVNPMEEKEIGRQRRRALISVVNEFSDVAGSKVMRKVVKTLSKGPVGAKGIRSRLDTPETPADPEAALSTQETRSRAQTATSVPTNDL